MIDVIKDIQDRTRREVLAEKLNNKLYFTEDSFMGYPVTYMFWVGMRGRGKTVSTWRMVLNHRKKYGPENVKCYYMRISDLSIKAMLEHGGTGAIPAILQDKFNLDLSVKGYTLYDHDKVLAEFLPLVSAAKRAKGKDLYDPKFLNDRPINPKTGKPIKRFIFIIIDEFMIQDDLERKSTGSPLKQFRLYIEQCLRDQEKLDYQAVRIIGSANYVSDCSEFLSGICNFIPQDYGVFKLTRKDTLIVNIPDSQAYIDKRKKSYGYHAQDYEHDSNYTNRIERDMSMIIPKGMPKPPPSGIIKFKRDPSTWFTVYGSNIIGRYTGQTVPKGKILPMIRHIDGIFDPERVLTAIQMYDAQAFKYTDLISQEQFKSEMKAIKPR